MGDIAQRGNKLTHRVKKFGGGRTNLLEELGRVEAEPSNRNRRAEISRVHGELNRGYKTGGRVGKFGGGRTNLLEELGRVEAEKSNRNRRAEISRVHSELNKGYAKGGRAGFKHGDYVKKTEEQKKKGRQDLIDTVRKGGIGSDRVTRKYKSPRKAFSWLKDPEQGEKYWKSEGKLAKGGRIGFKKGTDKKWMQKVSASIKKRGTKGKCTPITKPGCTGRAKALAKTFKKIAAKRKKS